MRTNRSRPPANPCRPQMAARIIAKPRTPDSCRWPVVIERGSPDGPTELPGVTSLPELYKRAVAHRAQIAIDEAAYREMVASGQAPVDPPAQIHIIHAA